MSSIGASLHNDYEYARFRPFVVEQLLSRKGRMLCPAPAFRMHNLDVCSEYSLAIRFRRVSDNTFTHDGEQWVETGRRAKKEKTSTVILHEQGPRFGWYWMQNVAEFSLKATNYEESIDDQTIFLHTQCKYVPVLMVTKVKRTDTGSYTDVEKPQEFEFPGTEFITATRYVNKRVADVKSDMNKFSSRNVKRKMASEADNSAKRAKTVEETAPLQDNMSNSQFYPNFYDYNQYYAQHAYWNYDCPAWDAYQQSFYSNSSVSSSENTMPWNQSS